MKNLIYLCLLLFANSIYGGTCNGNYTFSYGTYINCTYWFLPSVPGSPTIDHITFRVSSTGTYAASCDTARKQISSDTFGFRFCFSGNHDVTMDITFSGGSTCTVTQTINVTCTGADVCNPDPARSEPITNPTVEVTYLSPDTCNFNSVNTVNGCMSSQIGGGSSNYFIACGWQWAIRVPPSSAACHKFTYYVQYDSITSCGNYTCVQRAFDTTVICIRAYIDQTIYIVATSSSCCLPTGYQRGYYWTPTPAGGVYTTIDDPTPTVSTLCSAYRHCNDYTYCVQSPQTMNQTSGWPGSCFTGGGRTEQRYFIQSDDNFTKEQEVIIYTIQGIEVFRGKWRFGDSSNLYLNWPSGIGSGLYLVKFQDAKKGLKKLYKF
jgi:hypothetical protein